MKTIFSIMLLFAAMNLPAGEGYKVGDKAADFKLKNIDGKYVGLADFPKAKGFVVVFTCNTCPYAKAYQDRFIALDKEYKAKGFPVIAINANDPAVEPGDSYEAMVTRSKEKAYTFPYLYDAKHEVYRTYGATKTPHVFVLEKDNKGELFVRYIGAVDDNYQDPSAVKQTYLANAIDALLDNRVPDPSFTKAVGCGVKQISPEISSKQ
jgi:peroxiredoxin